MDHSRAYRRVLPQWHRIRAPSVRPESQKEQKEILAHPIELEYLAIQFTILKSKFYLRGLPTFQVWTDHQQALAYAEQPTPHPDS